MAATRSERKSTRLSEGIWPTRAQQFDGRLLAYALAGAGVVTLAPAAGAEIVYTPVDITLTRGTVQIDLNQDGINDFAVSNFEKGAASTYPTGILRVDGDGNAGAAVIGKEGALMALDPAKVTPSVQTHPGLSSTWALGSY